MAVDVLGNPRPKESARAAMELRRKPMSDWSVMVAGELLPNAAAFWAGSPNVAVDVLGTPRVKSKESVRAAVELRGKPRSAWSVIVAGELLPKLAANPKESVESLNRFAKISDNPRQRRDEEVTEAVPLELRLGKTILKHAADQRIDISERDEAVPNVAGRRDIKVVP